jgi:hypothetical protein
MVRGFSQNSQLRKIEILSSSNGPLNINWTRMIIPDSINALEYLELKKYVMKNIEFHARKEPERFFELMTWVSSRWPHDGWNEAPDSLNSLDILKNAEKGEKYRCVEYGKVLKDVLLAFGYISRAVGLKSPDAAYGGAGMGHVATEVWSDNLNKWIFLDPQFNIYAKYVATPLNIYELYYLKKDGRLDETDFISLNAETGKEEKNADYRDFISRYLGYMDIRLRESGQPFNLVLKMEGRKDYLTFQAFPFGKNIFTEKEEDLYFPVNRTMALIDYSPEEYRRSGEEYKNRGIESVEDFNKNMPAFAARPDFVLTFLNNMPWFERYEAFLNGKEIKVENGSCRVILDKGTSRLKVRAVNTAGIKGTVTEIEFRY